MSLTQQALQEEERIFQQEVTAVKQWFKKDRFSLVTRPYTAEEGLIAKHSQLLNYSSRYKARNTGGNFCF